MENAAELMKRFDHDGTGTLEKSELDKLKAFVRDKRAEIESDMLHPPVRKGIQPFLDVAWRKGQVASSGV